MLEASKYMGRSWQETIETPKEVLDYVRARMAAENDAMEKLQKK